MSACQPSTQDASLGDAGSPADLVLQGGEFFTVDEAQVWAEVHVGLLAAPSRGLRVQRVERDAEKLCHAKGKGRGN